MNLISVLDRAADNHPVRADRGRRHDGRVAHLHPQPHLLALGRLLHHLHRVGRARLHDPVGRQPGLDIHDQLDHVHWVRIKKNSFKIKKCFILILKNYKEKYYR